MVGKPFDYPYFIHDSYDSSDAINHFDWEKATNQALYPENTRSRAFTKGLIALRKSTDAFRMDSLADVNNRVKLLTVPGKNGVSEEDLVIGYQITSDNGDIYLVLVNADTKARDFDLGTDFARLKQADVLVDGERAGIANLRDPKGLTWTGTGLRLDALTATVLRLSAQKETPQPVLSESTSPQTSKKNEEAQFISSNEPTKQALEQTDQAWKEQSKATTQEPEVFDTIKDTTGASLPKTGEQTSFTSLLASLLLASLGFAMGKKGKKED